MKNLHKILLLLALLLGGQRPAGAQVFEWAKLVRNEITNSGVGQGGTTDRDGNTYVVAVNATTRSTLTKFDSTGQVVWNRPTSAVVFFLQNPQSMQADPVNGGFFLFGALRAGATWNGVPVPGAPATAAEGWKGFYGKCDAEGTLTWARPLVVDPNGLPPAMTVDGLGNCYIASICPYYLPKAGTTASMGGLPIDSTLAFVASNNGAGTAEWVRRLKAVPIPRSKDYYPYTSGLAGLGLGPKPGGGCLFFGTYNETLLLEDAAGIFQPIQQSRNASGTGPDHGPGSGVDFFISSLTSTGALAWIRPGALGGTTQDPVPYASAATADAAGNYYVTGTSARGIGVAKYNPNGDLLWVRSQEPQAVNIGYSTGLQLVVDQLNEVTMLAEVDTRPQIGKAIIGKLVLTHPLVIVHFDAAGAPVWATGIRSGRVDTPQTYSYFDAVALGLDVKGNLYYVSSTGTVSPNAQGVGGNNGLEPPVNLVGEHTVVGAGILVARIGTQHNTVRGRVYLDANGNGHRDADEGPFPQQTVLQVIQPTYAPLGTFDTSGSFNVYVGQGSYSLAAPAAPLHYELTEPAGGAPYTGSFTSFGQVDTARIFGYRPLADQTDLRVTLTPYGAARPGFLTRYRVTLDNIGTTTVPAGTATITLDAHAQFVSSTPAGTHSGTTVQVPYPAVAKFSRTEIDVLFSLPTNTTLGTVLNSSATATLASDVAAADNTSTAQQTVTGSFDPNDMEVNYQRLTPSQLAAGLPLDYTIRFQNMGTDTAFTVVLHDTLDGRKFNLKTLKLVAQSHNCIWSLSGTGQLNVRFLDIKLPHRGIDVIGSQGFVRFRVQPQPTLEVGAVIPNRASIVFDYNAPIRTNQATTSVLLPTAMAARHDALAWSIYPNPATEQLTITADVAKGGPVQLDLLDALGRTVQQHALTAPAGTLRQTLNLQAVRPGIYLLRLRLPNGAVSSQRVVRE
jgi:uncharacterized repeat protein (TIGR01451 family)